MHLLLFCGTLALAPLNQKALMIKSIPKNTWKKPAARTQIHLPKERYEQLYHKAQIECPTAAPVHDILELLLEYYLENEFVLSRKMILVNDPEITNKALRKGGKYRGYKYMSDDVPEEVTVWMRIEKKENDLFSKKVKKDGATKNFIMNLLIDFYLKNKFIIRSKIIRVNRQKTK
jgi:hypothetical protein